MSCFHLVNAGGSGSCAGSRSNDRAVRSTATAARWSAVLSHQTSGRRLALSGSAAGCRVLPAYRRESYAARTEAGTAAGAGGRR